MISLLYGDKAGERLSEERTDPACRLRKLRKTAERLLFDVDGYVRLTFLRFSFNKNISTSTAHCSPTSVACLSTQKHASYTQPVTQGTQLTRHQVFE